MGNKTAYVEKIQARLNQWDAEIENLKAKAAEAGADAKIKYYQKIDTIQEKQQEAQSKLDELRRAGDDAWIEMRSGVERAWKELEDATQKATLTLTR